MPFDFLEIEDNFVPDYAADPYRRKHIRTRYILSEGESMEQAENTVHAYIKEYIYKNTVNSPHIQERSIPDELLPTIYASSDYSGQTLEEQILACDDKKVLEIYKFIAKKDTVLEAAYVLRMEQLEQIEIQKQTLK